MVLSGKNRLSLRLRQKLGLAALLIGGAALTPGTISGDSGRVLTTFLGLFSASILPTVSLIVNSMTTSGRSVKALNELEKELQAAMDALFFLFGCIGVSIAALFALSIQPPEILTRVPYLTTEILPRMGQAFVVAGTGLVFWRAGQIPAILRRLLKTRHEISIDEARAKVEKGAPSSNAIRQSFATHSDFGKIVSLQELQGQDKNQQ